jgi:signal transduction histidine kinase
MPGDRPLVLIADDERNAVVLLTRILERDGFAVESAKDGETALQKATELHPDLILMDVQMPRMNGFEVTQQLRDNPDTARIPVIFVTAAAREPSDVAHGFQLGADDYIRKPYNYHELLARAHSKMRARQLEDRLQRRSEELEALVRIGGEFNQRLGLNELTELILLIASQELSASHAELFLFNENRRLIVWRDVRHGMRDRTEGTGVLENESTVAAHVFHRGEPVLVADTQDDGTLCLPNAAEFRSIAATPLRHHGRLVGILLVADERPQHFSENDLRLLRSIGEQAALAVRNAQLHAALQEYAQNLEEMVEQRTHELQAAQAQLVRTEKLAALGRLAAGIAHEVNNPLQPILNCLEVAIEDVEHDNKIDTEVLRVAEREVVRIKSIVTRLLDFARPSTADKVALDLHGLIDEILVLTKKQLEHMHIELQLQLESSLPLTGNPNQVKQVLLNVVLNAMQAMPDGGRLRIVTYDNEDGVVTEVSDTGVGMSEDTIAQIFEPFYSTKDDGTGLGLAVSYGIIQGHGGEIHIESEMGRGSRFIIWLPQSSTS